MKKIGILFGQENSFPQAFVERVNEKKVKGIEAEFVLVDEVYQGRASDYAVIIDRISQDVPFYRAFLKNAALSGTAVLNNPFWWSADEKFFNNALATKVGVPVPKTYLLPSKEMPTDTNANSFRNLKFPMAWSKIFDEIGFPAYMKPHSGGGWKSVYKVTDIENLFQSYSETGQLVMLLQEEINFDLYFRCYCLGRKYVRIMQYEPRNPHHLRYVTNGGPVEAKLLKTIEDYVLRLNNALGYDFNTVEFAVRDGIPYAIDFCNPAPDADLYSVGQDNFDWVVENAANMAIERAQAHRPGMNNLTWGTFMISSINGNIISEASANAVGVKATIVATATDDQEVIKIPGRRGRPAKIQSMSASKATGKRGRPRKEKVEGVEDAVVKIPGKRGRPRKVLAEGEEAIIKIPGKRGRPRKVLPEGEMVAKVPGKRGRPRKVQPEGEVAAKASGKRGRPRKVLPEGEEAIVKAPGKRGRPRKVLPEGEEAIVKAPGKRGRPRKVQEEGVGEAVAKIPGRRGRPAKTAEPIPADVSDQVKGTKSAPKKGASSNKKAPKKKVKTKK